MKKIQILDCTLRDGGLGLEDAKLNEIANLEYDSKNVEKIINYLNLSNLDIIEVGALEKSNVSKKQFCVYDSIEEGSSILRNNKKYALLFRGPDTPIDEIPDWNDKLCRYIRVIIRYSEIKKSLDFCEKLSNKGYKVFIQPMVTSRYTNDELDMLINCANKINAYALYIVDSYGHMDDCELKRLYNYYENKLNKNTSIGLHAHNNTNQAFSNSKCLIEISKDRDIIIDSTVLGMGQGAGNLQTELISYYLNSNYEKKYEIKHILETAEIIEGFMNKNLWGYSLLNLIPAVYKSAYKYATILREKYKLKYTEIDNFYQNLTSEQRNRYTIENLELVLKKISK